MTLAVQLEEAVKAVCPITGVSIGRKDDKATWRIDFKDAATPEQKTAAKSVLEAFDVDAHKAEEANELVNAFLKAQMEENDRKIIRALVEGDVPRIEAHKQKQEELRAKMK